MRLIPDSDALQIGTMGDAQSAQREGKKDAAAEEESGKVDDALTEQAVEDKVPSRFPSAHPHGRHTADNSCPVCGQTYPRQFCIKDLYTHIL